VTRRLARSERWLAAAEREQRKMAEDLHETLCQNLVGASLLAQVLLRNGKAGKAVEVADLEKLIRYVDEAIDESRLPFQEQSVLIGAMDLGIALEQLAKLTSRRIPCECRVEKNATTASPQISYALYRVAREAVRNAVSHSRSTQILIGLAHQKSGIVLTVSDGGCGFKVTPPLDDALHGIEVMKCYAASVHGTLSIRSAPGKGTTISCLVPHA
jgi:two-component system sensor histidine kinase DegS